jgi:hypothetical protein
MEKGVAGTNPQRLCRINHNILLFFVSVKYFQLLFGQSQHICTDRAFLRGGVRRAALF